MESPSPAERRRAWILSSRHQLTLEEPDPEGPLGNLPSVSIADDDVFSEGKIESWLLGCGSEACPETSGHQRVESTLKNNNSSFDDLRLGADASALKVREITSEVGLLLHPPAKKQRSRLTTSTPRQEIRPPALNMGHSMASSCPSSSSKTSSSLSEVLRICSEDAEETLLELGFGCDEPQVTARIPPRFFTFPSQAQGINFRLFLDSQLQRIRQEDPSLCLASRFRQVQMLTEMANAFYSLFSHVSRTPLQKLAPPEFSFSSSPIERMAHFRSNVRTEPRSPVERLKDTVSKMCLYTGSPHGSDSTSPHASPKKRLSVPDVAGILMSKVKTRASKMLRVEECDTENARMDQTQQGMTDIIQHGSKTCYEEMPCNKQTIDKADTGENKPADPDSRTQRERASVASSSGETVIETDHPFLSHQSELQCGLTDTRPACLNSQITYDVICPQIVESIHKVPFCPQTIDAKPNQASLKQYQTQTNTCDDARPSIAYSVTVTGLEEGGDICSINTPDSSHTPPAQTREESLSQRKSQYLYPLGHVSKYLQPVNSFELEEVHSAGEEDVGLSETTTTSPTHFQEDEDKGRVARGDSVQSDSSGYADEEVGPSSDGR
ncbi:protein TESPA1 [Genypterus blacodes]|uniref:protein TESPA1 n=1 Tax=Genypterus blacodes TaxID=154954 RepID=UPI003F76CAEB